MFPLARRRERRNPGGISRFSSATRPVRAAVVAVDVAAVAAAAVALTRQPPTVHAVLRMALLLGLSVGFEEASRTLRRLRIRFAEGVYFDMTSVWTFCGAAVLAPGQAALLAALIQAHVWLRHDRTEGMPLYRGVFNGAATTLAAFAASEVVRAHPGGSAPMLALFVLAGLVAFHVVGMVTVTGAMYLARRPVALRDLFGSLDNYLLELSTLGLGALMALTWQYEPAACVVFVLLAFILQRSAWAVELEQVASTDTKTGLLNAVAWQQRATRFLSNARRQGRPAAVLLIDLDHFKAVNDLHGHLIGDAALREVGNVLTHELRDLDLVGRFGGEEFVAYLPDVDAAHASQVAERIRARIRSTPITDSASPDGPDLTELLSASIGVACYPAHGADLDKLLQDADAAMYAAKRGGRNQVRLAG